MFWSIVIALLAITRLPALTQYPLIDNVNLAFALENFDPGIQPQPGYPLFVFFARMVVVGVATSPARTGSPMEIRVPKSSRILWLVGSDTPFHSALASAARLQKGKRILYTDTNESSPPFQVMDFLIVPGNGI
jgi:hypothetical protein